MIPTPEDVLPLVECIVTPLTDALNSGVEYAQLLQPDPTTANPWFWSTCARFDAWKKLCGVQEPDGWSVDPDVPFFGIRLLVDGLHVVRVLRSVAGTTPNPGHSKKRREAWVQTQLGLANGVDLPPLSLIIDWHIVGDDLELSLGLPAGTYGYRDDPRLHWRIPLNGASSLDSLSFRGGDDDADGLVQLNVDPSEKGDVG